MRQKPGFTAVLLAITLVVLQAFGPFLSAQTALPTAQELDQLLAPVALYPDSLLSQITTASTNPQEILDVDNWLVQNPGLTGTALTDAAQQQGFDPAFIALVTFPQVLEMMAQHIDDYAAIGAAFSADQGAVSNSIQRLRDQAYNAGTLQSTSQQQVEVQQSSGQTVYVIQPANPQVVYVPVYDPTVVYVRSAYSTPLITFGLGIGIGALLIGNQPWGWGGWGWNWGSRRAYYNHGYWGGWSNPYRPPRPYYRPRPIVWSNRPGYRGNWGYRPQGYRPPRPGGGPGYSRPPYGPGNRPGYRPPGNRPGQPSIQPVRPGTPNRPGTGRPDQNRPFPDRRRIGQPRNRQDREILIGREQIGLVQVALAPTGLVRIHRGRVVQPRLGRPDQRRRTVLQRNPRDLAVLTAQRRGLCLSQDPRPKVGPSRIRRTRTRISSGNHGVSGCIWRTA